LKFAERELRVDGREEGFWQHSAPLVIAILGTATTTFPLFLTGALAVVIRRHLGLSATALGVLVASFAMAGAVMAVVIGPRIERIGAVELMRLAAVVAVVALAGIALYARSFITFEVPLVLAGLANGAMQPAANAYLSDLVDPRKQGRAYGVKQAAIPVGTLLAGLSVPWVGLTIGWQFAYVFAAAVGLGVLGLLVRAKRRHLEDRARTRTRVVLAPLVWLAIGAALGAGAANALGAFFVSSAVHTGLGAGTAGYVAALGSAANLVTRLSFGVRADRRGGNHLRVVVASLGVGVVGYLGLAVGGTALSVVAAIAAYAGGWGWNGLFLYAVAHSHPDAPGHATALTQAGTFAGTVAGPLAFGLVVDHAGFRAAWLMASALAALAMVAILFGRALLRRELATRAEGGSATG